MESNSENGKVKRYRGSGDILLGKGRRERVSISDKEAK